MSEFAEKVLKWYHNKNWTKKRVDDALEMGRITQEEYDQIINE